MLKALIAVVAAGVIAIPHLALKSSLPAKDSAGPSPAKVVLTFTEAPVLAGSTITITKPDSSVVEKLVVKMAAETLEGAVAKPLLPGKYVIRWKASSDDGHAVGGTFGFTVAK